MGTPFSSTEVERPGAICYLATSEGEIHVNCRGQGNEDILHSTVPYQLSHFSSLLALREGST